MNMVCDTHLIFVKLKLELFRPKKAYQIFEFCVEKTYLNTA